MDISGQIITWFAYGMAFYILGVTIFLVANIAIGAVRARSALWWYLVYSVVVVGMMLIGLLYLPSMVLQYTNDGIEAAQPEIKRFTTNIEGMFQTAIGDPVVGQPQAPSMTDPQPQPIVIPTIDSDSGGGSPTDTQIGTPPTTPTRATVPTPTPVLTLTPSTDLQQEGADRLATVRAVTSPTPDLLNPPTPVIHGGGS